MKNEIKFGTDGWRGITGFEFTGEKIRLITSGVCSYLQRNREANSKNLKSTPWKPAPRVVIGYDTRFLSDRFAFNAAEIFSSSGIETYIADKFVTTPALSRAVVCRDADLGIMITASHNPYYYNGYKIKGFYGGSATVDIILEIEKAVNELSHGSRLKDFCHNHISGNENNKSSGFNFSKTDFLMDYRNYVLNIIDTEIITRNMNFNVVVDPMFGAGQGLFKDIIKDLTGSVVHEIHGVLNTSFGGINPEPIGENLNDAINALRKNRCGLALCIDGDGDRIGAIGENGNFVSSHHIFAIILDYLIRYKKLSGKIVKTVSTSSIIDRICSSNKLELITKPVGFKYIGEEILNGGVIMGGEESGGLWVNGYIPERDGIMIGLLLLEVICRENKTVNEILKDIYNKYGFFLYRRADYEIENEKKEKVKELLSKSIPAELKSEGASEPVKIDGFKYFFEDGSWIMIRPSGTEAVVRIYAESNSSEKLDYLHELGRKILEKN